MQTGVNAEVEGRLWSTQVVEYFLTASASKRETFFMKSVEMSNNETNISSPSLAFYCRYAPHVSWEDRGSAFQLISGLTLVMVSIPTIILNAFIILAEKQKKGATKTLKHFVVKPGRHRLSFSSFLLIFYWLLILLHVTCVSCYVTLLYVMLYYVTLCFVTLRYVT